MSKEKNDQRDAKKPVVVRVEEGVFCYKGLEIHYVVDHIHNEPIIYKIPEGFWDED